MKFFRILFLSLLLLFPLNSKADDKIQIIASVGNEAITNIDLINRIKIMIISSGLDSSPEVIKRIRPQVLQNLINEKLQIADAKKFGLQATDAEIEKALNEIEKRNKLPEGGIEDLLSKNFVPISAMKEQLNAEISWSKLKGRKIAARVNSSDDELNDFLKAQNYTSYRREYLISEIVLPVENSADESKILELANKLKSEIDSGKDFSSIARQFSQSPSGQNGGQVGWLSEKQLPKEILQEVKNIETGKISNPIRSIEGYYLVKAEQTRVSETNQGKNIITARQFSGPDLTRIEQIRDYSQSCIAPADFAKQNAMEFREFNNIRIRDLADGLRDVISSLEVGGISKPINTADVFSIFILCEKNTDLTNNFSDSEKSDAREFLFRRKLELESRKYLRELRAQTNIEIK